MKRLLVSIFVCLSCACTRGPRDVDRGSRDVDAQAKDSPRAPSPSDPIAIAAGMHLSCVQRRDRSVWCWGAGGVGNTKQQGIPFRVAEVADAEEISVGGATGCARLKSGAIPCFSMMEEKPTSGFVRHARSITNSSSYACAATTEGNVHCWSLSRNSPSKEARGIDPVMEFDSRVKDAILVRVGSRHACAVSSAGTVSCWGANYDGRLGVGHENAVDGLVTVSGLSKIVDLAVGDDHTCALDADGIVSCWGAGRAGQLGDGANVARSSPVRVLGLKEIVRIFAGPFTTCAKERGGKIMCFGDGSRGLMGDASVAASATPRELPWRDFDSIAIGGFHACSLAHDGRVRCWGSAMDGLLGGGKRDARPEPFRIPDLAHVSDIVAGSDHTVARLENGTLVGAGNTRQEALGAFPPTPLGDATRFTPVFTSLRHVSSVSAGDGWTCAIDDTGPFCAGAVAPHPSALTKSPSTAAPAKVPELQAVKRIVGRDDVRCAITTDGAIQCWGANESGQLGDGTRRARSQPAPVPGLTGVRDLDVSHHHACAVLSDESLHCWGSSGFAGLGEAYFGAAGRPTKVRSVPRAKAVATGLRHTCVLVPDGTVVCFGANDQGQLGDASREWRTSPVPVPGVVDAISLSTWQMTTCAVLRDGHVVCWGGGNYLGGLGVGDRDPHPTPTAVNGITNATQVSVGAFHTCARLADGGAACWGNGRNGQLGDGFEQWTVVPRDVIF